MSSRGLEKAYRELPGIQPDVPSPLCWERAARCFPGPFPGSFDKVFRSINLMAVVSFALEQQLPEAEVDGDAIGYHLLRCCNSLAVSM